MLVDRNASNARPPSFVSSSGFMVKPRTHRFADYNAGPPPILQYTNTGDSDVSPDATPSQFLLLTGLNTSVTEELLAKGAAKLYKIADSSISEAARKAGAKVVSTTATTNFGAQEGSIKRVFVVRDRKSDESWRYGFVEFHSVEVS
jgi:hypothetical protein